VSYPLPANSAQEATSEGRGLRRQLRSRLSAPNRSTAGCATSVRRGGRE
jgi:hypothetical protein